MSASRLEPISLGKIATADAKVRQEHPAVLDDLLASRHSLLTRLVERVGAHDDQTGGVRRGGRAEPAIRPPGVLDRSISACVLSRHYSPATGGGWSRRPF